LVEGESCGRPFVSIGVTTYNRHDLLRQTLDSILAQTFTDFEVIVGNDYTAEVLTGEMVGITDPRIRFVNHPRNLGEVGNMNALLGMATGRYFTWLFDDDLYEPNFLGTAYDCLVETEFPPAFFSSFRMLRAGETFQPRQILRTTIVEFSGREFLRWYSPSRPQIASILGLFDTDVLRESVGELEELCPSAIGVYSEYLFLVRCALLGRIVFIDGPFVIYRIHSGSWSESPSELNKYITAGRELVRRSAEVLRHPALVADFDANLMMICEQHLITVAHRTIRIETARKKFGVAALWRAITRYRQEAVQIRKSFLEQGGCEGFRTQLVFKKIDVFCGYTIVMNLASGFYRRNRACC
jgi:glycosyltransferase involved in cell wall biosynthesis